MAEVNIDVAKESTGQQILSAGAKEATSQEIKTMLEGASNSGGSQPKYSTFLFGSATTTPVTITGEGRLFFVIKGSSNWEYYLKIDDEPEYRTIKTFSALFGLGVEIFFSKSVSFYNNRDDAGYAIYYAAQTV